MLKNQLDTQGNCFEKTGGFREQLTMVRNEEKQKNTNAPSCDICNKPMLLRSVKNGKNIGSQFWCCSDYPNCKGVKNIVIY